MVCPRPEVLPAAAGGRQAADEPAVRDHRRARDYGQPARPAGEPALGTAAREKRGAGGEMYKLKYSSADGLLIEGLPGGCCARPRIEDWCDSWNPIRPMAKTRCDSVSCQLGFKAELRASLQRLLRWDTCRYARIHSWTLHLPAPPLQRPSGVLPAPLGALWQSSAAAKPVRPSGGLLLG